MCDHREPLAGMIVDYLSNHASHAIASRFAALAARERIPGTLAHDEPGDLLPFPLGKQPDVVVRLPQLDLSQVRFWYNLKAARIGDGRRRLLSSSERARVHTVNLLTLEPLAETACLLPADIGEVGVASRQVLAGVAL